MKTEIVHQRCAARFSARRDDREAGYLTYEINDGMLDIQHTVVDPALRGQGIGRQLIDATLDFAHQEGLRVTASCSYAAYVLAEPKV